MRTVGRPRNPHNFYDVWVRGWFSDGSPDDAIVYFDHEDDARHFAINKWNHDHNVTVITVYHVVNAGRRKLWGQRRAKHRQSSALAENPIANNIALVGSIGAIGLGLLLIYKAATQKSEDEKSPYFPAQSPEVINTNWAYGT